jgi:signal transduction histidine kinase
VVLAAGVTASAVVFVLPRGSFAPFGVARPPAWMLASGGASVAVVLVAALRAEPFGPRWSGSMALLLAGGFTASHVVDTSLMPPVVAAVAGALALSAAPVATALALTHPHERLEPPAVRRVLGLAAAGVAVLAVVWMLSWSPFADAECRIGCGTHPLALVADAGRARLVLDLALGLSALLCLGGAIGAVRRRSALAVPMCLLLATEAVVRLWPADVAATAQPRYLLHAAAVASAGVLVLAEAVRRHARHRELRRVAAILDAVPEPGELARYLARTLHDPALTVAYLVGAGPGLVSADGRPVPAAHTGRATLHLARDGADVAEIRHRPEDALQLAAGVGPAAGLLVDNERLQAELHNRLAELRESRTRLVERADAERRALERDLHDGAQQRLLMLAHALRRARDLDPRLGAALGPAIDDATAAGRELRETAHGIYPGVLESLGLAAAMSQLEDQGGLVVDAVPEARLHTAVERVAYRVVAECVATALHPDPVRVDARLSDDAFVLVLSGRLNLAPGQVVGLRDHAGALGGDLIRDDGRIEVRLPCASS